MIDLGSVLALIVVWSASPGQKPVTHAAPIESTAFATLEDFYGETGKRFRGAFGFRTFEPTLGSVHAPNSYGVAVDDMVISWKETRLDADTHDCAGSGECADLEVASSLSYDSVTFLEVTVTDKSPYSAVDPGNDCNGDGDFADAGDDQDCNDNGTSDVTARLSSMAEPAGEMAVLDRIAPGSPVYKARFPYSSIYDSPGTLFLQTDGELTVVYEDRDDGTGSRCKKLLDPSQQGLISARTTVAVTSGRVEPKFYTLKLVGTAPTNGDNDGFADADETIDLALTLINKSGLDLDDVTASLYTTDPTVECISKPVVQVGAMAKGLTVTAPAFRFKVAGAAVVNRTNVDQMLRARFTLTVRSNRFDALTRTTELAINLDLNATGGSGTSAWVEDFEGAGFGKFTLQSLDAGKNSLQASNGMRCQYNDPDAINSNSPGNDDCFLGFAADGTSTVNDWHIHDGASSQGNVGRAYTGLQSVHWGVHPPGSTPKRDTTRFKQLDAIKTWGSINVPLANANPELVFAHQVSLSDDRGIKTNVAASADRAIVQVNVVNSGGQESPIWQKLYPYENSYEHQGTNNFSNCMFDPTDDGNDEDDYFDPSDPGRRLGPSSTCYPEFVFSNSGDTDYRFPANPASIGKAGDGPGLAGSVNVGTWVRPRISLQPYAGRRIKIRFLATSIEVGTSQTWDAFYGRDDVVYDDGWYIDDVRVDAALGIPMTIAVDTKTITPISCGSCSSIIAALTGTPSPTAGPGQLMTVSASGSTADVCLNGVLQYQFWLDGNGNGIVGDAGDAMLRDFTDNSSFIDAPQQTIRYGVKVRCSSAPSCDVADGSNAATTLITVTCPSTGTVRAAFGQTIAVNKTNPLSTAEPDPAASISWPFPVSVDAIRGSLSGTPAAPATSSLKAAGSFTGSVVACLASNSAGIASVPSNEDPGAGNAAYYLVRGQTTQYCNQIGPGYTTSVPRERAGRDAEIASDSVAAACP